MALAGGARVGYLLGMRRYSTVFLAALCLVGQWPRPAWAQTRVILGSAAEAAPGAAAGSVLAGPETLGTRSSLLWLPRWPGQIVIPEVKLILPETSLSEARSGFLLVPAPNEPLERASDQGGNPTPRERAALSGLTKIRHDLLAAGASAGDVYKESALLERLYVGSSRASVFSLDDSAKAAESADTAAKQHLPPASHVQDHIARFAHIPVPAQANPWMAVGVVGGLTALATVAMAHLSLPRDGWVGVTSWLGSAILIGFPLVHVVEIFREMRALKRGGEEAKIAQAHLGGVSVDLHIMLKIGKLLKYPGIYASASHALMVNTLSRSFLSWVVLAMLTKTGHMAKAKFAFVSLAAATLVSVAPLLASNHALVTALGVLGAVIYGLFTLPQYRLNYQALLKLRGTDPQGVLANFERLRGNNALFLSLIIIGKILIIPTYIATNLIYNASSNLFSGLVTLLILFQMGKVGLLPWQNRVAPKK